MGRKRRTSSISPCEPLNGLDGLDQSHQNKLNLDGLDVAESANIEQCYKKQVGEENANTWDYYIGLRNNGELYVEIHKVNEDEIERLAKKAEWLQRTITAYGWPQTEDRPFFVAPTAGITPGAVYGDLSRRLALKKMRIVMKGTSIAEEIGN